MQQWVDDHSDVIEDIIRKGLKSRNERTRFLYFKLLAEYVDGKPVPVTHMVAEDSHESAYDFSRLTVEETQQLQELLRKARLDNDAA